MRQFNDSAVCVVPREVASNLTGQIVACIKLEGLVRAKVRAEFSQVRVLATEWTFCTTEEEIEAWDLPHVCPKCAEVKPAAVAALRNDSTVAVALGKLYCVEPD